MLRDNHLKTHMELTRLIPCLNRDSERYFSRGSRARSRPNRHRLVRMNLRSPPESTVSRGARQSIPSCRWSNCCGGWTARSNHCNSTFIRIESFANPSMALIETACARDRYEVTQVVGLGIFRKSNTDLSQNSADPRSIAPSGEGSKKKKKKKKKKQ